MDLQTLTHEELEARAEALHAKRNGLNATLRDVRERLLAVNTERERREAAASLETKLSGLSDAERSALEQRMGMAGLAGTAELGAPGG